MNVPVPMCQKYTFLDSTLLGLHLTELGFQGNLAVFFQLVWDGQTRSTSPRFVSAKLPVSYKTRLVHEAGLICARCALCSATFVLNLKTLEQILCPALPSSMLVSPSTSATVLNNWRPRTFFFGQGVGTGSRAGTGCLSTSGSCDAHGLSRQIPIKTGPGALGSVTRFGRSPEARPGQLKLVSP